MKHSRSKEQDAKNIGKARNLIAESFAWTRTREGKAYWEAVVTALARIQGATEAEAKRPPVRRGEVTL